MQIKFDGIQDFESNGGKVVQAVNWMIWNARVRRMVRGKIRNRISQDLRRRRGVITTRMGVSPPLRVRISMNETRI